MKSIFQVVQNLLKPYIDAQDTALSNALTNDSAITHNELGAKNYVHINYQSQTINGLTITVHSTGRIDISGKANAEIALEISDFFVSPAGENTFTIEQPTGSTDAQLIIRGYLNETYDKALASLSGTSTKRTFNNDYDGYNQLKIILYIRNGVTINTTLGIMVRPSSIVNDTYVPYAMTNRELTRALGKPSEEGTVTLTLGGTVLGASMFAQTAITFTKSYKVPPIVIVHPRTSAPGQNGAFVSTISTTGAVIGAFRYGSNESVTYEYQVFGRIV